MRILKNLTRTELDYYTSQPTAKALHECIMGEAVTVPQGDRTAAAVYVAGRQAERTGNHTDKVELSPAGQELSQAEKERPAATSKGNSPNIAFSLRCQGEAKVSLSFASSAMVHRAVEQGFIELEGRQLTLTEGVKKQLLAADRQIQEARQSISFHNMLLHEAANARQAGEAMKEANDKMSRVMTTAMRIMHGRKVSPADEKELMEFNKDLYAMAKSAAALEEQRRKRDDREDDKISRENDEARAREAEPKDYSVEETPLPQAEVQIDVSLEGEAPPGDRRGGGAGFWMIQRPR